MKFIIYTVILVLIAGGCASKQIISKPKWIIPNENQCIHIAYLDNYTDKYGCSVRYTSAKKTCELLNARLPTMNELNYEIIHCGGTLSKYAGIIGKEKFEKCIKDKGFSTVPYWSSEAKYFPFKIAKTASFYGNGSRGSEQDQVVGAGVLCVKKNWVMRAFNSFLFYYVDAFHLSWGGTHTRLFIIK